MRLAERLSRPLGLTLHPAHARELEAVRRGRSMTLAPLAWVTIDPDVPEQDEPARPARVASASSRAAWCERRRRETEDAVQAACDRIRLDGIVPTPANVGRAIGKHRDYTLRVMARLGLWGQPKRRDHRREERANA